MVSGLVVREINPDQSKILINLVRIGTIYSVKALREPLRNLFVAPKSLEIIKNNKFVMKKRAKTMKNKTENLMWQERGIPILMCVLMMGCVSTTEILPGLCHNDTDGSFVCLPEAEAPEVIRELEEDDSKLPSCDNYLTTPELYKACLDEEIKRHLERFNNFA